MNVTRTFLIAAAAVVVPISVFAYTGEQLEKTVKVSSAQAQAIALKRAPGKIVDIELEKEAGGTGLRYSMTIVVKGIQREVGVDANTGAILEDSVEGENPD
jgi:uncharacterized membrane protein YkoI